MHHSPIHQPTAAPRPANYHRAPSPHRCSSQPPHLHWCALPRPRPVIWTECPTTQLPAWILAHHPPRVAVAAHPVAASTVVLISLPFPSYQVELVLAARDSQRPNPGRTGPLAPPSSWIQVHRRSRGALPPDPGHWLNAEDPRAEGPLP
ncbi:hypothetical protein VPH35_073035 [Triticum aestivum]